MVKDLIAIKKSHTTVLLLWYDPKKQGKEYKISRSWANGVDYQHIMTIKNGTAYIDSSSDIVLHNDIRYRVKDKESEAVARVDMISDSVAYEAASNYLFQYNQGRAGVRCNIYCKIETGERCPECWSEELNKVTKSKCSTCDGSGIIKGFKGPVVTYVKLYSKDRERLLTREGLDKKSQYRGAVMGNTPLCKKGDIILVSPTERFVVVKEPKLKEIVTNDNRKYPVKQDMILEYADAQHMAQNLEYKE